MTPDSVTLQPKSVSNLACPVLVRRKQDNNIWVARLLGWAECWAEGATREEALKNLQQRLAEELADAELMQFELPRTPPENPWLKMAGAFKDDPDFDEFVAEMEAERQRDYAEVCQTLDDMEREGKV